MAWNKGTVAICLRSASCGALAILTVLVATGTAFGQGRAGVEWIPQINACRTSNSEEELDACSKIIESKNENIEDVLLALERRAAIRQLRDEFEKSIEDLTTLIKHEPRQRWLRQRGLLYSRIGNAEFALKDLVAITDPKELDSEFYLVRGHAHYVTGNDAGATADYESAIRKRDTFTIAIGALGILRLYQNDAPRAAELLRRAHKLDPNDTIIAIWLDEAEQQTGNPTRKLSDLVPKRIPNKARAALVAFLTGTATIDEAINAAQDNEPFVARQRLCETRFFIGVWQRRNNNVAAAVTEFENAIIACARTPGAHYVVRARNELRRLQRK